MTLINPKGKQRIVIVCAGALLLLALLVPPWRTDYSNSRFAGYGLLFAPTVRVQLGADGLTLDTQPRVVIDFSILLVECFCIAIAGFIALAFAREPKTQ